MGCEFAIESEHGDKCYITNGACRYITPSSEKCKNERGEAPYNYSIAKEYRKKRGMKMRKCRINDIEYKFHMFEQNSEVIPPSIMVGGHRGGQLSYVMAIVEDSDGNVLRKHIDDMKFTGEIE